MEIRMNYLVADYRENIKNIATRLRVNGNFDIIERHLSAGKCELTFFYIDGFTKDGEMQKIMQYILSLKEIPTAGEMIKKLPYIEVETAFETDPVIRAVLSGQAAIFSESFGASAVLLDTRTYPARNTAEPDSDRVMQGAHDGFVETLVMNTALIRRRIRDERLTMKHFNMGGSGATDVVLCYMDGVASPRIVEKVSEKLKNAKPKSLTLGFQSLAESLIRRGWFNPFPKIKTTERPDTAAAQLLEGSVLVICDTSPQVMILPTSVFMYLEQTDDYYFPPVTGSYLRIIRTVILLLSVVITPLWYLTLEYSDTIPSFLQFLVPDDPGALPIILQLFLVEAAIDGLKIASMNTPDMLSNSLSIVGALILGDFAVEVGWLCADVILYMAFVAIANFAQQNSELGYALKFIRLTTLLLVFLFGAWGLLLGFIIFLVLLMTNNTVTGMHYLYPLIPFKPRALARLIVRDKKRDFNDKF